MKFDDSEYFWRKRWPFYLEVMSLKVFDAHLALSVDCYEKNNIRH
jgi:hypothetical protein